TGMPRQSRCDEPQAFGGVLDEGDVVGGHTHDACGRRARCFHRGLELLVVDLALVLDAGQPRAHGIGRDARDGRHPGMVEVAVLLDDGELGARQRCRRRHRPRSDSVSWATSGRTRWPSCSVSAIWVVVRMMPFTARIALITCCRCSLVRATTRQWR